MIKAYDINKISNALIEKIKPKVDEMSVDEVKAKSAAASDFL